ncbi:MAG TPA: serine hydrolase [Flavobacterium sp.]|uniref:serine hydrolase n=1 Tax=unclassified Flavobacterium TaxID=196869 RepID=UPI0025C6C282|nr:MULTISPECIES: serine hydrolase [unclassified Flavobacterium]HRE76811.1 serine hydrolase [Flavobacterium sp.]
MKYSFLLIALFVVQIIFGQNRFQQLDSLLTTLYKNGQINGNFLIAEEGQVLYKKSFGIANEETKQPLDENSIFELASVSKQFTAMAIMILSEKGKLNLDDHLAKFIPELAFYKDITIRHLLNHTSGLPDYVEFLEKSFDKSKIATNNDIISIFAQKQPRVIFNPNSTYEYSNTGYVLLASIIEKTSGETYASFLQKSIFKPLKMNNTFVYTRRLAPKKIDNYAYGYVYSESLKKYVLPDNIEETNSVVWLDGIVGDGSINSTVNDLLKWDRALYKNKLLSKNGIEEMFKVATLNDSTKTKYGYGWQIDNHDEFGKIVYHGGGWPGYATFFARHITNDKTIIILQNHDNITLPLNPIRNILYGKNEINKTIFSDEQLQKFVGDYELQPGFIIEIVRQNDRLYGKTAGQPTLELTPETQNSFLLEEIGALIMFSFNPDGTVKSLTFSQGGMKLEGMRLK